LSELFNINNLEREKIEKLNKYVEFLLNASKKIPLMAIKNREIIFKKYIFEANYYFEYINNSDSVVDFGSGGGFPGIPLSINFYNSKFYLVDRKKNVCNYLMKIKKELNLKNVYILNIRAEDLKKLKIKFDKVVARAFNRIDYILKISNDILRGNGLVILGKGNDVDSEIYRIENKNFELFDKKKTEFGYIVVFKKF
jgi:16S rRNA (guanine527-N7)-methyltransferase